MRVEKFCYAMIAVIFGIIRFITSVRWLVWQSLALCLAIALVPIYSASAQENPQTQAKIDKVIAYVLERGPLQLPDTAVTAPDASQLHIVKHLPIMLENAPIDCNLIIDFTVGEPYEHDAVLSCPTAQDLDLEEDDKDAISLETLADIAAAVDRLLQKKAHYLPSSPRKPPDQAAFVFLFAM